MGSLAKHLNSTDPKRVEVIDKLLEVLRTPSEPVQLAVAQCLCQLAPSHPERVPTLISATLELCLNGETYGERRGGAFGLAGLVKGLGVSSIKKYNITDTLQKAIENKEKWTHRQGALFAVCVLFFSVPPPTTPSSHPPIQFFSSSLIFSLFVLI